MCGINGSVRWRAPVDRDLFLLQRDAYLHRGPDDAGVWFAERDRIALGSRRLAILDLSPAGRMPMEFPGLPVRIVFNGEVYNFRSLRDELVRLGHAFRSGSDTEVVLTAYVQWGESCLERFDGMFALAIHDERDGGRLFLARDRAGEKPLYYRLHEGGFDFASELKALLLDPDAPRRFSPSALAEYLAFGYVSGAACLVDGMRKLPPAHALVIDLSTAVTRVWRYWSPPQPSETDASDETALEEELERLLLASVRDRLVADVPVGVLLSGGVDSSLVTALAATTASRVRTFTVGFPGHAVHDERAHARLVARRFGTEHVELEASPADIDLLERLAAHYDEPLADSSLLPTFLVSRLCREHVTVALGGDGGDELFGGYGHYAQAMRLSGLRRALPRPLRRLLGGAAGMLPVGFKGRSLLLTLFDETGSPSVLGNVFDHIARSRLLGPNARRRLAQTRPEADRRSVWRQGHGALDRLTRLDFLTYFSDDILTKVDRASMAVSLEMRAPWLSVDIMEFAFARTPARLKCDGRRTKILPKRLARRLLPPELDTARKQGFSIPIDAWLSQDLGRYAKTILAEADPDLLDRRGVQALLDGQGRGRANGSRIFALLMLELWRRRYRIGL